MTNRDEKAPSMRTTHNTVKKNSENFAANLSQSKRIGGKPSLELYRPPKNQKNGAMPKVHFQSPPVTSGSPQPHSGELKSALKRSKSFTGSDRSDYSVPGFEKDAFPQKYLGLIRRAIFDPNVLDYKDLMEVVRVICGKAVESITNAQPAAHLCFSIIEKENSNVFLESLLNACQEWFNERDKLLRSSLGSSSGASSAFNLVCVSRRWTAYVYFLTELYIRLKSQHRESLMNQKCGISNSTAFQALTLTTLLFECCLVILKPPALYNVAEIESFRTLFITVGKQLEEDSVSRMYQVMDALRDAFVNPSVTAQIRKTLLEMIELHASGWQLGLPQSMYYFPYTNVS